MHPQFLAALQADRSQLNSRFRLANAQSTPLDAEAFKAHLADRVQKIIAALADRWPERSRIATSQLFDVSLQLFRSGCWCHESSAPELDHLWENTLPRLHHLVARDPERVAGSLSNAVLGLIPRLRSGTREWLDRLAQIGQACDQVSDLLQVGKVLAWQCGLVELRGRALEILEKLPRQLAWKTIGLTDEPSDTGWHQMLDRLRADRWCHPASVLSEAAATRGSAPPQLVGKVSGFRGFGGAFVSPPTVYSHDGLLYASDTEHIWRIEADRFGSALQRVDAGAAPKDAPATKSRHKPAVAIDPNGRLKWHVQQMEWPHLSHSSSQAFDGATLAITLPTSFHVFLVARAS